MRTFTTLCYMEKDDAYLMLHRTKKEGDINHDKYIGIGGHIEHGESPEDCIQREIYEETGLTAHSLRLRGLITFVMDGDDEYSFLYTCDSFSGTLHECDEGDLRWVAKSETAALPLWEGDKIFFRLLRQERPFFSLKLTYIRDRLTAAALDGREISLPGPETP